MRNQLPVPEDGYLGKIGCVTTYLGRETRRVAIRHMSSFKELQVDTKRVPPPSAQLLVENRPVTPEQPALPPAVAQRQQAGQREEELLRTEESQKPPARAEAEATRAEKRVSQHQKMPSAQLRTVLPAVQAVQGAQHVWRTMEYPPPIREELKLQRLQQVLRAPQQPYLPPLCRHIFVDTAEKGAVLQRELPQLKRRLESENWRFFPSAVAEPAQPQRTGLTESCVNLMVVKHMKAKRGGAAGMRFADGEKHQSYLQGLSRVERT